MGMGLSKKAKEALENCKKNGGTVLNFSDCGVEKMKNFKAILKLPRLVKLDLSQNSIRELPKNFKPLKQLEEFSLARNLLTKLEEGILVLDTLKLLNLSKNKLKNLPDNMSNLLSLEDLDIGFNDISSLPHDFGKLNKLKRLNYESSELKAVPREIWDLKALQEINFKV